MWAFTVGLGDAELVGDDLVRLAGRHQAQDVALLGCQRGDTLGHRGALGNRVAALDLGLPGLACQHVPQRVGDAGAVEGLRDVGHGPGGDRLADHARVLGGRDDHDRQGRKPAPEIQQPAQALSPRHLEIEQEEVEIGDRCRKSAGLLERAGLQDLGIGTLQVADSQRDGLAKQRVIVGDQHLQHRGCLPVPFRQG